MKKITLMILVSLLSFCTYGQLALEDFETAWTGTPAAPPGGWVVYSQTGSITWTQTTAGNISTPAFEGSHAAFLNRQNVNPGASLPTNWLITPQFNAPVNGQLHFYSRLTFPGDYGSIYTIKIVPVQDASIPVQDLPWTDLTAPMGEFDINPVQMDYVEKTINIPPVYTGQQVRIVFIMQGDNMDRWLLDNIEVVERCDPASVLEANNTTLTTADLKWISPLGVTSWEIAVLEDVDVFEGSGEIYSGPLPYHKTGLTANTKYMYYVRSLCTGGGKSSWTGPFYFTTPAEGEKCGDPLVIPNTQPLPYTTSNTTANFKDNYEGTPGTGCGTTGNYLSGNDVVYSYTPVTNGAININLSSPGGNAGIFVYANCAEIGNNCLAGAVQAADASAAMIPALTVTANTTYYIVVSGTAITLPYTLSLQQVSCAAPTALTVNGTTPASAAISWTGGTASAWQVAVQPAGTGLPDSGQDVMQNNLTVTSTSTGTVFTEATDYEVYVRTNCGDGTYSIWSGPFLFATTQNPALLNYSENFDGATPYGWYKNNGNQDNKWVIGSATGSNLSNSLYISEDGGISNTYNIGPASVVHAYRDIQIPLGIGQLGVSFDTKIGGELNDYIRVWLVPASFIPTPGTQITTANSNGGVLMSGDLYAIQDWTTQNLSTNASAYANTTRRLVFEFRNNTGAGTQPGAAIDNISIKSITCPAPTALTVASATQSSATYTWTAPAGIPPAGYEYYYSQIIAPAPNAATQAMGTSTAATVTIPSLSPSQQYYVWVRSSCGTADKSFWTGPVMVTVPQVPASLDYSQNFDGGAHEFIVNTGTQANKWIVGSSVSNSPSKSLYVADASGTNNYYAESTVVCHAYRDVTIAPTAAEIRVSFDYKVGGDANDYFKVWMVPAAFTPNPGSLITAAADRVLMGTTFFNTPEWTTATFDLPVTGYQNQLRRLVFEWRNNSLTGTQPPAAIDNITINVLACPKPVSLTAANVNNTTFTLDWTEAGSAAGWEVAYMPTIGAAVPTTPGTTVTDSQYTIPAGALVQGIQYVYYVRSNCGNGTFSTWSGPFAFALKPVNDECAQATVVPVNPDSNCTNTINSTIAGATASSQSSPCLGTKDDDVWFEFTATNTSHIITISNITGSGTDLFHGVYSGANCTTMTPLYCGTTLVSLAENLTVGQTYKIRVWTFAALANQNSNFNLCITTPPLPPVNDNCAGAISVAVNPTLVCGEMVHATVESATASPNATTCAGGKDDDVWFTFTATNTTHRISLKNITGSAVDLYHVLYSGNCAGLTQVYCSDPNDSWASNLTIGQTYYIRVYTYTSVKPQNTSFDVCIGTPPPSPANDNCGNASLVTVNPTLECQEVTAGTIQSATASPEANTCNGTEDDDDVWFQFTATSATHLIELKNLVGTSANLYHILYSGDQCTTLAQLYCSDPNNSLAQNLVVGQIYKIRVFTNGTVGNQNIAFDVCVTTPPPVVINDECAAATVIPVNTDSYCKVNASGSVFGATASNVPNTCSGSADDDVWFEFTATNSRHLIYIDNITGSTSGLYHILYSGDCGALSPVYCSTTSASTADNLVIGQTYKVRVFTSIATANQTTSFDICIRVPNTPIIVSDNTYTKEQLVTDILFKTPCATITNITSISGADFGDVPSIGYFDAPGSGFPFSYGVVLSTANVNFAKGPFGSVGNTVINNSTPWGSFGDNDLKNLVLANDPTQNLSFQNATVLEFDFVPVINKFEFQFLFASTEYGSFQCTHGDAFAFILTDQDGNSENLAVLPDTNIPVSVLNIRDGQYNLNCGSSQTEYFGQYNVNQPEASAINFHGQTVPLKAFANVIPGQNYHIKLVIADYKDTAYSSAVFLGGGTFDIGTLALGSDLLVVKGTAICDTETTVIDTKLPAEDYTFIWYKNGDAIDDETGSSYQVSEPGTYGVVATLEGIECSFEGSIIVEQYPHVADLTGNPENLTYCDAGGFHTFDLTPNLDAIVSLPADPENFVTTIHLTEADAQNSDNPIDPAVYNAYTNVTEDLQTLWTRTVYNVTACVGVKSFDLIVQDLTPAYTIDTDFSICEGTSGTIDVVITDSEITPVAYSWTRNGTPLPDTTPSITVTEGGAYIVVLSRTQCTASATVNVVVTPIPVADAPADITMCGSYELPELSPNNTYYNAVTNAMVPALTAVTETTTFNVVASSGTTPECTSQNTFTVTINNSFALPAIADVSVCDNYVLPLLTAGNYYTASGGTGTLLHADDVITATQTIYVYAETGTVPNCTSEESFIVTIIPGPVADDPGIANSCDTYELPALSPGNAYYTGQNGTGELLPEGYSITQSKTIYIFARTNTTPDCTDEKQFNIVITPKPVFNLGGPYNVCSAANAIISVSGANFNDNDASYAWTLNGEPVAGDSSITGSGFGTYALTVTLNGCSHTESILLTQNTDTIAVIITDSCEDGDYKISAADDNGSFNIDTAAYKWKGPDGFTATEREFSAPVTGEYFVTVTTADGCVGENSFIVTNTGCDIQKGISPNGDGKNDAFDLTDLKVKKLSIFNRYGEEEYTKNYYTKEWQGQSNGGEELPTGTYFYRIERLTGETNTGWIYINRQE